MKSLSPKQLLLGLMALFFGIYACWYCFVDGGNQVTSSDAQGFINYPFTDLKSAFNNFRTPPYALFLKFFSLLFGSYFLVPLVQVALYLASLFFLFTQSQKVFGEKKAFIFCASLVPLDLLITFGNRALSDHLGVTLFITSLAFCFRLNGKPPSSRKIKDYVMIGLSTFLALYTRPALLFLLIFTPLFLFLLDHFKYGKVRPHLKSTIICFFSILFFLGSLLSLRYSYTKQWGVSSSGAASLVRLSSLLITPEIIKNSSEKMKPVLNDVYKRAIEYGYIPEGGYKSFKVSVLMDRWTYSKHLRPVFDKNWVVRENTQREIVREVLFKNKKLYLQWIIKSFTYSFSRIFIANKVLFLLLFANLLLYLFVYYPKFRTQESLQTLADKNHLYLLFIAACAFYVMSQSLIVLSSRPIDRYLNLSCLFLYPFLAMSISILLGQFFERQKNQRQQA
jgi:hypothetical protein